jgi:hypothetical protein
MKRLVPSILILGLAGCGQVPDQREQPAIDREATDPSTSSAPGIAVTAAPGVAFTYSYDFRLPAARIAGAQEVHAQACEKLGIARCRITGMRYSLTRDNQVAAALAFKLDPALARAFGRQGIAAIEAAEGMLTNAEITGSDAAGQIAQIEAGRARIAEERERIDAELARPGLTGAARAELLRQRGDLDAQGRSASSATAEQRAALANTPMTFNYESGSAVRGFDPRSPLTDAVNTAIDSAKFTLTLLLGMIAVLGPPALLFGLIFLLGRWIYRRWPLGKSMRAETTATD